MRARVWTRRGTPEYDYYYYVQSRRLNEIHRLIILFFSSSLACHCVRLMGFYSHSAILAQTEVRMTQDGKLLYHSFQYSAWQAKPANKTISHPFFAIQF